PWLPENTQFMDCGYGASEGKFNVPMRTGQPEGPLSLFSGFFEFEPLAGGEPLLAHEVKDGESYKMLITTFSGLYRYDLHDIVVVKGFTGRTPNIHFISKTEDFANLAGEKITGASLSNIIRKALDLRGFRWRHFCMVADGGEHRYIFCVEPEPGAQTDAELLADIARVLREESPVYRILEDQRLLQRPRLHQMKSGWQEALYAERRKPGVSINQIKLPIVTDSVTHPDMIEKTFQL
ncbi:MAG: GH3 auxin-responsive promoter family protein, partial [Lentisphaerota bacterium]